MQARDSLTLSGFRITWRGSPLRFLIQEFWVVPEMCISTSFSPEAKVLSETLAQDKGAVSPSSSGYPGLEVSWVWFCSSLLLMTMFCCSLASPLTARV